MAGLTHAEIDGMQLANHHDSSTWIQPPHLKSSKFNMYPLVI